MSNITITHEVFKASPEAAMSFRMFLLHNSLAAGGQLRELSLCTPFRVFHVDALYEGHGPSEQGYFIFTFMQSTSHDAQLGKEAVQGVMDKIAEIKSELIHVFGLTPVTQD